MKISLYSEPMKIELNGNNILVDDKEHEWTARKLSEMEDVMMQEPETALLGDPDMYYMYREVLKKNTLRFDITVLPPRITEKEYNKTYGHYHPEASDGISYPEVYQVLNGKAAFILQKRNNNGSIDAYFVGASKGDTLLIPPNFGHVTINQGDETLALSNLVSSSFNSVYDEFKTNHGAAYYYLEGHELVQNPNYFVRDMHRIRPDDINKRFGFESKDLLSEFAVDPERFSFLEDPKVLLKNKEK
jgi:glucose-6-phosphate isomerase